MLLLGVDIMPSVNDVLCILIIPLLDYLVYPHLETSMRIKLLPLHKVLYTCLPHQTLTVLCAFCL